MLTQEGHSALTNLEKLILALEDRRFFSHLGIDFKSVIRELLKALRNLKHGGASTIDMQLVRTATGYKDRAISRKLYEQFLAVLIQFRYSKLRILRSYLSCAFFGSHLNGADAASNTIFAKNAADLTIDEASIIAAMLVYPKPLVITDRWEKLVKRRASYGVSVYISMKNSFDKVPC